MKTALITGSFDPVTVGHTDIIRRAAEIFDSVTVALCHNTEKKYMFTPEQREKLLTLAVSGMKNVKVAVCRGLVADFAAEVGASVIVRGYGIPSIRHMKLIWRRSTADSVLIPKRFFCRQSRNFCTFRPPMSAT